MLTKDDGSSWANRGAIPTCQTNAVINPCNPTGAHGNGVVGTPLDTVAASLAITCINADFFVAYVWRVVV